MTIQFNNTLTREKDEFIPIKDATVLLYSCGPTVYNYVHIGNLRAYVFVDLLKRYLLYRGYKVNHVMNITDVEDKTIRSSQEEGKSLTEFTQFYEKAFLDDIKSLNITLPDIMPRATEYIPQMVEHIKKLEKLGHTYQSNGSTYFKIDSFPGYGRLARLEAEHLKDNAAGRLDNADEYEKENARDFVLWKAWTEADGDVYWETELGKGRPGWHIECSVMSSTYLGETFDIHTGGEDLVFPHHTNEIAQSEAVTGKPFVNYWLHNAHLIVNGKKMSKSLGNFYTLRDLTNKGYDPFAIRYALLETHYRQQLNFTFEGIDAAQQAIERIRNTLQRLAEIQKTNDDVTNNADLPQQRETLKAKFTEALDDDLNISKGLAALFEFVRVVNASLKENTLSSQDASDAIESIEQTNMVLGIIDPNWNETETIPDDVKEMAETRYLAKKEKDFTTADRLRDEINKRGYVIEDQKEGYRVTKKA